MRAYLLAALLPTALACGPTPPAPVVVQPKFSDIQQKIFLQSCGTSSCHAGGAPQGSLDLVSSAAYQNLVGAAAFNDAAKSEGKLRVDPGHPENSFLLEKIGGALDPKYGVRMPEIGDPVSAQAVGAIRTWISNGAPND